MRRLQVLCAVAGTLLAAYAVAQNNSAGAAWASDPAFGAQSKRGPSTARADIRQNAANGPTASACSAQDDGVAGCTDVAALPANARVVATGVAARAMVVHPGDASNGNSAEVLEVTLADSPNRVFAMAIPAITTLPAAQSKRDSSTACPGASRNTNSAGHFARNDSVAGCAANMATAMAVVAGVGQAGSLGDGGAATSAQLDLAADSLVEHSGIAVAPDGTIFIADTQNSTIRSVAGAASSEPGVIRSVAGRWAARQNIALAQPMGIAVDRAGNLYIADDSAGAVDVLSAATGQLSTLAQVVSPASIAVKPDGSEVFVASPATGAVFAISANTGSIAAVSEFAPAATANSSAARPCANVGNTAQAAAASAAACPAGLATDARGDLFVADARGGKIIRVDAKTSKSTTIASGLSVPGAIALDAKGNLYVAEQGANRVLVLPDVTANSGNITLTAPAAFAAPCPQVTDPFTYCNMPSGGTSPTAAFTLTNTSSTTAATAVTISVTSGDFTVETKSCTVTLPASGTCLINVAFTPQGSGARTGILTVTDSDSGDSATYDLAGTGDDYSLQLASGQSKEVNVLQGGTATFKAMVAPDSVFGQNGEMVKFQCPSNLPLFATCAFSPCPVAITPGAAVAFSVTFVTSSAATPAPGVTSCGSSGVGPGVTRNPTMILRAGPERTPVPVRERFPSLWWLALAAILGGTALIIAGVRFQGGSRGTWPVFWRRMGRVTPSKFAGHSMLCPYEETTDWAAASGMWRVRLGVALASLAMALAIGCGGKKTKPPPTTPVTPTGVTGMTILGNATDASGNSLGTSRSLEVTLDVVTQ